jgi:NADPH2:quinone reductase
MSKQFLVHQNGGPEVLQWEDHEVGAPGPGQLKIRHHAIGLNFVDTYERSGLYKHDLPFVPGSEGAGEVIAVGDGVVAFKPGDRICYRGPRGAYSEERLLPADSAILLPDWIDYETAAAVILKGLTSYYLLFLTYPLAPGHTILFHAAAGGVGLIACQWAHAIGARVIGTAGSPEKVALALANGCDSVINYRESDFAAEVKALTGGELCDVVYDGVGRATFEKSLDCLKPRGLLASFGNASGPVSIPNLGILATKGSLFLTRPRTDHYFPTPESQRKAAAALFETIREGSIKVTIGQRFPLSQAPDAHRALEGRQTIGSTLLLP